MSYATSLMKKGVLISTTEHLLSAFIGAGIDNAIVELDNLELPILDGSARPFVEMIHRAGIRKQRRERTYLRIRREFELREGDKFIAVYPADTYSVSYTINFPHPMIGKEEFSVDLSDGNYLEDIAPARTFGFVHEADVLRQQGLIRGASTDNAIVLTRDGVMNPPLRFDDEFVRHKVLDLIGDLALLGKQISAMSLPIARATPCTRPSFRVCSKTNRFGKKQPSGIIRSTHLEQVPDGSPLGLNLSAKRRAVPPTPCA